MEVRRRLPSSVLSRLDGTCHTLKEAEVCIGVAERAAGTIGMLYVADNIFDIPVQVPGDSVCFDELLYYLVKYQAKPDTFTHGGGVARGTRRKKRRVVSVKGDLMAQYHSKVLSFCSIMDEPLSEGPVGPDTAWDTLSAKAWWAGKEDLDVFPERFGTPFDKTNIRFKRLWRDVCQYFPRVARVVRRERVILQGYTHDEACGWLIWLCASQEILGGAALAFVAVFGKHAKFLKLLNTAVKAFGLQQARWGSAVCELSTLAGRGVGELVPDEDVRTRVDYAAFLEEKAAVCERGRLRSCIEAVIAREMAEKPVWHTKEEYWSRRWLFTKSGSHSRSMEREWFGEKLDLPPLATRREFAEAVKECMVAYGEPRVEAGYSEKAEHGKTRAIYGCDSVSYFTFDYLLKPVEAVWRNSRVLLDPGRTPQGLRYKELAEHDGYKYMLDFDDYNSQHEIEAMKMVIEIACKDAPPDVLKWALDSWDNMFVHWVSKDGLKRSKMVGTLPSGHRATTFVNTILNAAYCLYASSTDMSELDGYHCGDDVIVFGDERAMSLFVKDMCKSVFKINPAKQSVGQYNGEFLRVAFDRRGASGYGARSISAMVSGNWTTDNRLDKTSYIDTMLRNLWTLCARFRTDRLGVLGLTCLRKRAPEVVPWAYGLVTHEISWNGSPVKLSGRGEPVLVLRSTGGRSRPRPERLKKTFASDAMLSNHIDFTLMDAAGIAPSQVHSALAAASGKPREYDRESLLDITEEWSSRWGVYSMGTIASMHTRPTVTSSEALNVLSKMFTKIDWVDIVRSIYPHIGGELSATGTSPWPLVVDYNLPYSDCMAYRNKVTTTVGLLVTYPVTV
ncbi:RNA dependent RNA polymerase [Diatom colony associated dsRNA virus 3]|uniref:RNA dependent RNA polymerase n=1 Tax=Diatom colony associated dsRNA virus 3 TaxID=1678161 RepID=UPI0007A66DCB|nr:RNA dependent RNA polymerase [Diatom colony associated dsRNA virus 3]BAU79486.1 RNA dependent RNA polymerase [Diatom colony associated dsRNA virus 3]